MDLRGYSKRVDAYPVQSPRKRRPVIILAIAAAVLFTIFFSTSNVDKVSKSRHQITEMAKEAAKHVPHPSIPHPKLDVLPNIAHPFRPAAHEPLPQGNKTAGDVSWFDDWKWLNPFSSSITLDEQRSVLPPAQPRMPIYTYYDADRNKDADVRSAEGELLTVWRRAWWAKGFKPIVLGRAEAMRNPLYELLQSKTIHAAVKGELMRWLAWSHMGTGMLANYLLLPMGPHEDALIAWLRRGGYDDNIRRYESLGTGLFSGRKEAIDNVIRSILDSKNLESAKTFLEAPPTASTFVVEPVPDSIAFYETTVISAKYKEVADAVVNSQAKGLRRLAKLINDHLHKTFLEIYPAGFDVLTPKPILSAWLAMSPITLVNAIKDCPKEISCPPNKPKCAPCESRNIKFPAAHQNNTESFTVAAIPHPYTWNLISIKRADLTVPYIRRESPRDPYVSLIVGPSVSLKAPAHSCLPPFKALVADPAVNAHSNLFLTVERPWVWEELEHRFGFSLPRPEDPTLKEEAKISEPVSLMTFSPPTVASPAYTLNSLIDSIKKPLSRPSDGDIALQAELLHVARQVVGPSARKKKGRRNGLWRHEDEKIDMREVVEAWNLVDTEAWRFVRAFAARGRVERAEWINSEESFEGMGKRDWW